MPSIDYRQLRSQIAIRAVLDLLRWSPLSGHGDQRRGSCPLPHCANQRRCCFSVNLRANVYRCFACGSQGNALDLWAAAQQLTLHLAAQQLCQRLGVSLPLQPAPTQLEKPPRPSH